MRWIFCDLKNNTYICTSNQAVMGALLVGFGVSAAGGNNKIHKIKTK